LAHETAPDVRRTFLERFSLSDADMPKFLALLLTLIATPAAAWTVMHERDRMTDKTITRASVRSGDATLLVGCLNGQVQSRLTWGRRIGFGDLGVSYRFDAGPVTPRMAMVSQDGTTLYAWPIDHADALAKMRKAKRLRVSVGQAFYDFDLAAGEGMPVIRCG
jgi:hypothetical protein